MTETTYDYVVVGAGSAGCVMARRLSEQKATQVLLLEAGRPDDKREIQIPILLFDLFRTEVDWAYSTEPQSGMHGREMSWPRGKTLGGCSSINAMVHVRGHPSDYDQWASLGNEGWEYAEVLPFFKKSENFSEEDADSQLHASEGPLHVTDPRSPRDLSQTFVEAAVRAGYQHNADFNGRHQEGFGLFHLTQKNGRRQSVADAYLKPALDRSNLTVETGAHTRQILFEGDRAVGVRYEREGQSVRANAAEEVILCGGTINSPQLLMLSGIGPADHLREHEISVQQRLPGVGQNLQDHLTAYVVYKATKGETLDDADSVTRLPLNLAQFYLFGRGPLTSNIAEAAGFIRTEKDLPAPDLEVFTAPAHPTSHRFDNPEGIRGFSFAPVCMRPESRGRISLRSADPFEAPAIDPQYLTESVDLEKLVEGIRRSREIARTSPLDEHLGEEIWPGGNVESDEALSEYIRERGNSVYHPVGTCRMGDSERAVVDERLRVHGTEGLRVVDASVMPTIVGGHTNAPTVMIAEKAADMIKDEG